MTAASDAGNGAEKTGLRAVLYARVSTKDQKLEPQLLALRQEAAIRHWRVVEEAVDRGVSGARERRPGLDRVMSLVRSGKVDALVVVGLDRFARSVQHLLRALEECRLHNVEFLSIRERLDTSTPIGKALFTIVGALGEMEREILRERVRAGLAVARQKGIRLGRPTTFVDVARARRLLGDGRSARHVARVLGVAPAVLRRALQRTTAKPDGAAGEDAGPETLSQRGPETTSAGDESTLAAEAGQKE